MTVINAFLRAVNVGGRSMVPMADLRKFIEELGFSDVKSLLQSGNVVFRSNKRVPATLERTLETEAAKRLSLETAFFVRTTEELQRVIDHNPFPDAAKRDPGHLLVLFLKDAPAAKRVKELQAAIKGREVVGAHGKHAYIFYPDGIGRSKVTNALIEKKLGTQATGRNWNTVLKMAALGEV